MSASDEATDFVIELVARLGYKPGSTMIVTPDATCIHDPAILIDMGFDVPDSITGEPSRAGCGLVMPEAVAFHRDRVLAMIRQRLIAFEIHELDEFLTLDGIRINDPHCTRRDPAWERLSYMSRARGSFGDRMSASRTSRSARSVEGRNDA